MSNMMKFAAQQLTKKQMNEVKGGRACAVHFKDQEAVEWVTVNVDDQLDAANTIYDSLSDADKARVQNINC